MSTATIKANQTKRSRWERLVTNPDAAHLMRHLIAVEDDRYHAMLHLHRIAGQCPPRCFFCGADAEAVAHVLAVCDLMSDEIRITFCRRFGVTIGYLKRFRSRTLSHMGEEHVALAVERFTDEDRAALAAWLAAPVTAEEETRS